MPRSAFSRTLEPLETLADWQEALGISGLSSTYQPLDSDLTAIAALTTTTFGRSLLTLAAAANLKALVPSFELAAESQPTSDVASVTFTGLSGYSILMVFWTLELTADADLNISGATSGGTHRTVAMYGTDGAANVTAGLLFISNFGIAATHKVLARTGATLAAAMDASDATTSLGIGSILGDFGYVSFAEIWDEFRIAPTTGNIEGSTADSRGRISIWGLPK